MSAISAKIDRFQDRFVVLKSEAGGIAFEISWPVERLPPGLSVGMPVSISLISPDEEKKTSYEHMRRLLEELIN